MGVWRVGCDELAIRPRHVFRPFFEQSKHDVPPAALNWQTSRSAGPQRSTGKKIAGRR
jgi:hypothetical protein